MSKSQDDGLVLLNIEQGVAILTVNNVARQNSLDRATAQALKQRLDDVWAMRDELRGMLLCANGDHFMVGGDIRYFKALQDQPDAGAGQLDALIGDVNHVVRLIDALPFPVIAFVQGAIAGAGVSLALACDMVVAADDARFVLAYSALGVTPDGGASWLLPRRVGQQRAMHMFLFNEPVDAAGALDLGLVVQVVERSELQGAMQNMAKRLTAGSRLAQNAGKALIRTNMQTDLAPALENEKKQFVELVGQRDFQEGVNAFIEKRAASFPS